MRGEQGRGSRTRRLPPRATVVVVALVVAAGAGALLLRDTHRTSAQLGPEGSRTFEGVPDDLPAGVVPPGADEVEATVARAGDRWTAAVTFVAGSSRDDASTHVDAVLTAAGYAFRQRAYDERSLEVVYDGSDGSVLSVTYADTSEGTGTAVVLRGPESAQD
jgi:hypothetical protein